MRPTWTHLDWAIAQEIQIHVFSKEVTFRVGGVKFLASHEKVRGKVVSWLKKETEFMRFDTAQGKCVMAKRLSQRTAPFRDKPHRRSLPLAALAWASALQSHQPLHPESLPAPRPPVPAKGHALSSVPLSFPPAAA